MSKVLADQIANMMSQAVKPAGSGVEKAFDRTLHPPKTDLVGDHLSVQGHDAAEHWGWIDTEHQDYWHRVYIFMADQQNPDKGLAAVTLTHHFKEPVGYEGILDINNQLALAVVVGRNSEQLSRRATGQEFCEPSEIIEQVQARKGAAHVMVQQIQTNNFMAAVDNTCRFRNKGQSAAYVLEPYVSQFKFMNMLGFKAHPVRGGVLHVRDIVTVH